MERSSDRTSHDDKDHLNRAVRSDSSREEAYEGGRQRHHNAPDFDTRSLTSSQKSDPDSEISDRGFRFQGHVHFGQTFGDANFLNVDKPHQFPPSDTATVCSCSVLEDIEDASHYSSEGGQNQNLTSNAKHHHYPLPSEGIAPSNLRRSNSAEGNRLVDFAGRSQVTLKPVVLKQNKSLSVDNDECVNVSGIAQHKNTICSSSRTGSVKSSGLTNGSVCGDSLTDTHSNLNQEDDTIMIAKNSAEVLGDGLPEANAAASRTDTNTRGVRRYKGRFYSLPLKRFRDGVQLNSDNEQDSTTMYRFNRNRNDLRHDAGGHDYHGHPGLECKSRSRSRSRSRSPPSSKDHCMISNETRGFCTRKEDEDYDNNNNYSNTSNYYPKKKP